jgi:hypothetical protein
MPGKECGFFQNVLLTVLRKVWWKQNDYSLPEIVNVLEKVIRS